MSLPMVDKYMYILDQMSNISIWIIFIIEVLVHMKSVLNDSGLWSISMQYWTKCSLSNLKGQLFSKVNTVTYKNGRLSSRNN